MRTVTSSAESTRQSTRRKREFSFIRLPMEGFILILAVGIDRQRVCASAPSIQAALGSNVNKHGWAVGMFAMGEVLRVAPGAELVCCTRRAVAVTRKLGA